MSKFALSVVCAVFAVAASPALALNTRTFVSALGDDTNTVVGRRDGISDIPKPADVYQLAAFNIKSSKELGLNRDLSHNGLIAVNCPPEMSVPFSVI
jgi:hypothetical protein